MNLFAQNVNVYPTDTTNTTQATNGGIATGLILIYLIVLVLVVVGLVKIYTKADRKWWEAIIPIYSTYVLLKIVGRPGWWLLLYFIPFVNVVISFIVIFDLAKVFGKGAGTALGLIFLPFIFLPVVGFSDSYKYKSAGASPSQSPPKPAGATQPSTSASPDNASGQAVTNIPAAGGAAVGVGVGAAQENEPITSAPLDQQPAGNPSSAIGSPPASTDNEPKSVDTPDESPDQPTSTETPTVPSETDDTPITPEPPVETPQPTSPTPPVDEPVPAPPSPDDQQNNL